MCIRLHVIYSQRIGLAENFEVLQVCNTRHELYHPRISRAEGRQLLASLPKFSTLLNERSTCSLTKGSALKVECIRAASFKLQLQKLSFQKETISV